MERSTRALKTDLWNPDQCGLAWGSKQHAVSNHVRSGSRLQLARDEVSGPLRSALDPNLSLVWSAPMSVRWEASRIDILTLFLWKCLFNIWHFSSTCTSIKRFVARTVSLMVVWWSRWPGTNLWQVKFTWIQFTWSRGWQYVNDVCAILKSPCAALRQPSHTVPM